MQKKVEWVRSMNLCSGCTRLGHVTTPLVVAQYIVNCFIIEVFTHVRCLNGCFEVAEQLPVIRFSVYESV